MTSATIGVDPSNDYCPQCGEKGFQGLKIIDPKYGERNMLQAAEVLDISESGEFFIHACLGCGFKLIANGMKYSSSQLSSYLVNHVNDMLDLCHEPADVLRLRNILNRHLNIPLASDVNAAELKLTILSTLISELASSNQAELVDLFNGIMDTQIEDSFGPNTSAGEDIELDTNRKVSAASMLVDD